ncbi:hypothetical protein DSM112329_00696 [Paraconexibacter sp. AEG42_29]|uniref:FHA domain-containing protein n=1 Tax=Paraconexibacter sp. AEG42_29 TaxID=2997339 RepID=A0AAU7AQB5_9ACTN
MSAAPVALLELSPVRGREHRLVPGAAIGRAGGCRPRVGDPLVSRRHAQVWAADAAIALQDLGSRHGTFVNGERVTGITALGLGDRVMIGATLLLVVRERLA